jgi:two-component system phosphate regulon response regulator PhoB
MEREGYMVKHAKVMVVEDNETVRTLLSRILANAGCIAVTVSNGEHAWLMATEDPPDLMLVDYDLPELNGADLIQRIRHARSEHLAKLPIIGITVGADWGQRLDVAGATAVMQKPFNLVEIIAAVRKYVRCEVC